MFRFRNTKINFKTKVKQNKSNTTIYNNKRKSNNSITEKRYIIEKIILNKGQCKDLNNIIF